MGAFSYYYGTMRKGHSYAANNLTTLEAQLKKAGSYLNRPALTPTPAKACHACGQKLPLKVGEVVEGYVVYGGKKRQGIVANSSDSCVVILEFATGAYYTLIRRTCTRLHGYYRITEREAL